MGALQVDHHEVCLVARRQPATVRDAQRPVAVSCRPAQRLLRRRLAAVLAPHPLHEQAGAHHLDHVLGHVVRAHADVAAVLFEVGDPRAEAATRGNGGVERDIDLRLAQQLLLRRFHAAAMGADDAVVEETEVGKVLGRQAVAMGAHRGHLAPDLVEMDGDARVELFLQRAQVLQQLGRAHVGRPGRDGDAHPTVGLAVPVAMVPLDVPDVILAQRAVELIRRRIADRGADAVVGAFGEQETHAGIGQGAGVMIDVVGIFQHVRGAAAQRLQRAQQCKGPAFVGSHLGQRDGRQAAGEGRLVRGREVLEHAARQGHGEMRVDVGEAWHDELAAAVDLLGRGIARQHLGAGADGGNAVALDGNGGLVVDAVGIVDGDDGGVVDHDGQRFLLAFPRRDSLLLLLHVPEHRHRSG